MLGNFDFWLLAFLIGMALVALNMRDLIGAVLVLSAYSLCMALLFALLGAVDVALVEATLGGGITSVILIAAVLHMKRRSKD
ncbi:MAG: hydrogenase subunit MbhD domain-containing protein [Dehalococcoidales bacterium]|jgi:uncharacterized MnhB-related membrane protein|nr:DUF4040 domain-containing protein [Dehalococcoidales bacterium]MDD5605044.1 DUF4040 domain-containing protein [Dehalococcoidales bacterium]MDX9986726.1 DUF4040 domain-containing protein [Dehalococcoidales bacterium]NLE90065.1 DUF4040 domain-containing protein [Dehalococcoidales bacterium]